MIHKVCQNLPVNLELGRSGLDEVVVFLLRHHELFFFLLLVLMPSRPFFVAHGSWKERKRPNLRNVRRRERKQIESTDATQRNERTNERTVFASFAELLPQSRHLTEMETFSMVLVAKATKR